MSRALLETKYRHIRWKQSLSALCSISGVVEACVATMTEADRTASVEHLRVSEEKTSTGTCAAIVELRSSLKRCVEPLR